MTTDTAHITKEGLLQAIEKSEHLAGWQKASIIRAAELSTHSANCLSLQSEDNPPLPCDCGAGLSAQESKPWIDVEGIPLMTDYALGWNACRQATYEANAAPSVSAQDANYYSEQVRNGIRILKQMAKVRQPEYELPADSFLERAVCEILGLMRCGVSYNDATGITRKQYAPRTTMTITLPSAQDASPKDGYTGWLLEQEIKGVILYYRKTAFTEMPTRDATEANLFHSQYFAQQVADRLGCGWLVREHAFRRSIDPMNTPASAVVPSREAVDELVDRFLSWPVPTTECADPCASMSGYQHQRVGTNFLSAEGAKAMLLHVLADWLVEKEDDYTLIMMQGKLLTRTVNILRGEPAPLSRHSVHDVAELAQALLAEVERLNTHAERLSRINREVLAESELLSAAVADQAAALAERDKVTDAMVERARIAETNFNVDIRGNGSCDRRAWHHSTEWTFGEEVFQSIDEAKIAQNRARLRMAIDAALAASVSSASEGVT